MVMSAKEFRVLKSIHSPVAVRKLIADATVAIFCTSLRSWITLHSAHPARGIRIESSSHGKCSSGVSTNVTLLSWIVVVWGIRSCQELRRDSPGAGGLIRVGFARKELSPSSFHSIRPLENEDERPHEKIIEDAVEKSALCGEPVESAAWSGFRRRNQKLLGDGRC